MNSLNDAPEFATPEDEAQWRSDLACFGTAILDQDGKRVSPLDFHESE